MSAPIAIVDENDQTIGAATKQEAWEKGLVHRIVRVMVEGSDGRVLLQHRSPIKDIFPNCWDNSAAGHVDEGEDYDTAVAREIAEELGFADLQLTVLGSFRSDETWEGYRFNRFTRCYKVVHDGEPQFLEKGKIDGFRWFTVQEVKRLIADHPDEVTDGLRQVFARYY